MRRPTPLTLLTAALLVLLPTLAVLQFRWVGQVSEAERERMQAHLRNAAHQFRESLDGEIARAFISLQLGGATARDGFSDRFTDRYDAWLTTTAHPQIVADVFLVDAERSTLRVRRWNPVTHVLDGVEWPAALVPLKPQFEQELAAFRTGPPFERRVPTSTDETLIVAPLRPLPPPPLPESGAPRRRQVLEPTGPVFGFTVVQLDLDYIRTQLLPELSQRHFMLTDGDRYRVSVVTAAEPRMTIYQSDPEAPTDPARADASESLFGIRGDFLFFNRGGGRGGDNRRVVVGVFRGAEATPSRQVDGGGDRSPDGAGRGPRPDRDFGRWRLLAQHQSGSLEAAVARARLRNLVISFGILLLLSVSVAMLALSSRRAERLARQQMEFVAGVSHELRTPIAVIRSAAENLSHGVIGSPDKVKRYGEAIGTEARRLGEMVERVLQYAGLEAGLTAAARIPLAPAEIIDIALDAAAPVVASSGVRIERTVATGLPAILGDAIALRSALQNLIANAVKYGGDDRWVGVRAERAGEGRRTEVRIIVEDHGRGIPAEDLPHIFEPFYRGTDAVARQVHGNGLGLSIVHRIVTAHGGRVTVSTRPGAGSAFTIVLPAADPAAAPAAASLPETGGAPLGVAAQN